MLTVYTKNNCGYCMQAKLLLKSKNVEYTEINIEEDLEAKDFILSEGHRSVPQIYKDGKLYVEGGFTGLKEKLQESVNPLNLGSI